MRNRPIYVVDTNILIDYVEIIPNGNNYQPEEPTIDLSEAHIVIPTAVIRELSKFKHEKSDRGKAARIALRRIRDLFKDGVYNFEDSYNLDKPISIKNSKQLFSVLPIHKNFKKRLPFSPSEDDMDGQIILAALTAAYRKKNRNIDRALDIYGFSPKDVTLLTNDNGLAIRAAVRGIQTKRYGYKYPEPYTGRRDIIVPVELFNEFYNSPMISREYWEELMPNQPKLIANEFIIMNLEDPSDYPRDFDPENNPYFLNIGRFDANEDAIMKLRYANSFPIGLYNPGQAIYAEALMDPNISAVICAGPAGTGKTYMATVYGYLACKAGDFIGVTVVPCENRSNLGALPGDLDEKMDPDVKPIKNALRNYLLNEDSEIRKSLKALQEYGPNAKTNPKRAKKQDSDKEAPEKRSIKARLKDQVDIIWDNWFSNIPIEHARGNDFSYELAIYDEFQDQNVAQADTLIKRLGYEGKIIITGDIEQIHVPYIDSTSSGLIHASRQLLDSPMVAQVCFTEEEVVRHPLVKMIAMRQKQQSSDKD